MQTFSLSDPLLGEQWHLQNTGDNAGTPAGKPGEDLTILPVWESYRASHTGSSPQDNQIIAIVDTGIELHHDDLFPNMSSLQQYHWDYVEQNADPSPTEADEYHGTAVAGLAGARGDNALGISGTAPLTG